MEWLTGILLDPAQQILVTVLLGLLSVAAGYATQYINRLGKDLQRQSDSAVVDRIIQRTAVLVQTTVLSLEGTVAKQIRQAMQDGKATREELVALKDQAIDDVLEHLGAGGKEILAGAVGDVRDWVGDLVEANLEKIKRPVPAGSVAGRIEAMAAPLSESISSDPEGSESALRLTASAQPGGTDRAI